MESRTEDIELIARRFSALLQVEARAHLPDDEPGARADARFCAHCTCPRCDRGRIFEYGLMEAFRWQGRYVYYCPAGLGFMAACRAREGRLSGGITLGPFLLGEQYDRTEPEKDWISPGRLVSLPRFSPSQADALEHILLDAVQLEVIDSNVPNIYTHYEPDVCQMQQSDIAHKIKIYLHEHFAEKLSLQDIALQVYLSRSYVSTLFKEETGCRLSEYLNAVRIDHACTLLRDTRMPLAEVAQACGFEDQSYFNRVFKKALCCSPIQSRKSPTPEKKAQR